MFIHPYLIEEHIRQREQELRLDDIPACWPSCSPPAAAPPPCFAEKPADMMQLDVWPSRQEDS